MRVFKISKETYYMVLMLLFKRRAKRICIIKPLFSTLLTWVYTRIKRVMRILHNPIHFVRKYQFIHMRKMSYGYLLYQWHYHYIVIINFYGNQFKINYYQKKKNLFHSLHYTFTLAVIPRCTYQPLYVAKLLISFLKTIQLFS